MIGKGKEGDIKVDVAIIGAGTAGLSALREVRRVTQNFVIINGGSYGTTCARVGCMPSKVLIQVANDFHRRHKLSKLGISGGDSLQVDDVLVMQHVRTLRDRFVGGVLETTEKLGEKSLTGYAKFVEPNVVRVEGHIVRAKSIIIANGSRPVIPKSWASFRDKIITSDELFELEQLPKKIAVVGLGVIGLELGQALHRLGVQVTGVGRSAFVGGLTDPEVNRYAVEVLQQEMNLHLNTAAVIEQNSSGQLEINLGQKKESVDLVLASLGRRPNLDNLGLEALGLKLDEHGMLPYSRETMQVADLPIYIAGDVNGDRPILHEAADEGRMAGFNSTRQVPACFKRRSALSITFCDPNLARAGATYSQCANREIVIGQVKFDGQGRALVMAKNKGFLRIYGCAQTGEILGAEMMAPSGEHLAHLLAWAIQADLTVNEVLQLPFYHPVVEEGLRTALRDLSGKLQRPFSGLEMAYCDESGVETLC